MSCIDYCRTLPAIVNAGSVDSFKGRLDQYYTGASEDLNKLLNNLFPRYRTVDMEYCPHVTVLGVIVGIIGIIVKLIVVYIPDSDDLSGKVDLIVCLGGDGTLLYASTLFQVSSLNSFSFTAFVIKLLPN